MATVDKLTTIYSAHSTYLERVAAKFGNDVVPYLESIEKRISKTLSAMPNKTLTPQETAAIRAEIDSITREELKAYTTQYKIDNREIGQHQVAFDAKTLESVITGYEASIPSAGIVNKLAVKTPISVGFGQFSTYNRYIANYWQQYTKVINDTVSAGFISGGTNREIAKNILSQITIGTDGGDLAKAQRAAKTMARTGTNHYATQSTIAFVDKNDEVLIGYRMISTLDGVTSRQCSALDQIVFKKDDPNIPWPPGHPNCRRRVTYEVDGRYRYDDSASTRPSNFRDAEGTRDPKRVSSKKTYHESLKAMSKEDRNSILGAPLGNALSKMSPEEFSKNLINSTYEPLSIADMKENSNNAIGIILKQQ
jgi:SPP1 gp7 family putative phage head morphogenesis protein